MHTKWAWVFLADSEVPHDFCWLNLFFVSSKIFSIPHTNEAAYDHTNEMPLKYWRNLFAFFGYKMVPIPNELRNKIDNRGTYICMPFEIKQNIFPEDVYEIEDLGISEGGQKDLFKRRDRRLKKYEEFLPPFIFKKLKPFLLKALLPTTDKNGGNYRYTPSRVSSSGFPQFDSKDIVGRDHEKHI